MIADTILANLVYNEKYSRRVIPYLEKDYFETEAHRKIYDCIEEYTSKYNSPPSIETLKLLIEGRKDLNEKLFKDIQTTFKNLVRDPNMNEEWLIEETEKYCQSQAFANALRKCITIYEGGSAETIEGAPQIMTDALGVSFDSNIGHDFFEDYESRYEFYHRKEERIPFDIKLLNVITKGGLPRKSLTCYLAECVNENTKVRVRLKKKN